MVFVQGHRRPLKRAGTGVLCLRFEYEAHTLFNLLQTLLHVICSPGKPKLNQKRGFYDGPNEGREWCLVWRVVIVQWHDGEQKVHQDCEQN